MGHVRDLWTQPGPSGRRIRNPRWGHGKRWLARWIEHGAERSATFSNKDSAVAHLARITSDGPAVKRPAMTVGQFAELWLGEQLHYASTTRHTVRHRLSLMILPTLGEQQLTAVTRSDVQKLVVDWTARYAPATVHQSYSFLTTMFAAAVRDGMCPGSPCADVNLPSVQRDRVTPLTVDEVSAIADRVPPWYRAMVIVGAATGLRSAELRGLTISRLVGNDVIIDRQLVAVERGGTPVFEPPKSKAGDRRISLGYVAADAISEHLHSWPGMPNGIIFVTRERQPIRRTQAAEIWHNAIDGMQLGEHARGWHALRHFHASQLISAGMSPKAVAERLGHADASETLKVYSHIWPSDQQRMADVMDVALAELRLVDADVISIRRRH